MCTLWVGAFAFVDLSTIIADDIVYFWGRVYQKISHCFCANPVTLKASGVQPFNFPVVSQLVDVYRPSMLAIVHATVQPRQP